MDAWLTLSPRCVEGRNVWPHEGAPPPEESDGASLLPAHPLTEPALRCDGGCTDRRYGCVFSVAVRPASSTSAHDSAQIVCMAYTRYVHTVIFRQRPLCTLAGVLFSNYWSQ